MFSFNSSTNQWTLFTRSEYFFQTGLDLLTLKEDIFRDHPSIIIWKIELEAHISSRNVSGKSSMFFFVNFPPRQGYCNVNPENGTTLTRFLIKCSDWIDTEGSVSNFAFYGKLIPFKIEFIKVS